MGDFQVRGPDQVLVVEDQIDVDAPGFPTPESLTTEFGLNFFDPLPDLPHVERMIDPCDRVEKIPLAARSAHRRSLENRTEANLRGDEGFL
jgi:hypothetical protein